MIFKQFSPHPALSGYIAAYWMAKGDGIELKREKILPDGCIDIIFNLGAECKTANGAYTLQNEKAYWKLLWNAGTMTIHILPMR